MFDYTAQSESQPSISVDFLRSCNIYRILDVHDINAFAKCGQNPFLQTHLQYFERKRNSDVIQGP